MTAVQPPMESLYPELAFIGGWFPQANSRHLAELISQHDIRTAIEIGSFLGLSAAWLAQRLDHVTCVDRFYEPATLPDGNNLVRTLRQYDIPKMFYEIFIDNMERAGVWNQISAIMGDSHAEATAALVRPADLLYVDGDHSYEGCLMDLKLYVPKARKIVCGDDYQLGAGGLPQYLGVRQAVQEYFGAVESDDTFWWIVL